MRSDDTLNVWYGERLVGELWREDAGNMGFQYASSWVSHGFPISQQLPLTEAAFSPATGVGHHFFANLLPEAGARTHIVRHLKMVNSDFALLKAIGGECAGALTILPVNVQPDSATHYQLLTLDDQKQLFQQKGNVLGVALQEERPRFSLAGAQDKCAIYVKEGQYYLPAGASPSSHILKFEIAGYRNVPAYEYYLALLARRVGLPTVDVQLKKFEKEHYLLIKRYDRIIGHDDSIKRLHQEDFCQALGFGYERKYQADGGPSFRDCYELLKRVSINPLEDSESLLKWQIFNILAGNSDGHAKNISLAYHGENHVALAPYYDLVCTRAIEGVDSKIAFSVGGEYHPDKITLSHWLVFAGECHVRDNYLKKLMKEMAERLLECALRTKEEIELEVGGYQALQRAQFVIVKQSKKMLKMLREAE